MGAGPALADGRSGARGHLRRVRGARRRHHLAGGRPPAWETCVSTGGCSAPSCWPACSGSCWPGRWPTGCRSGGRCWSASSCSPSAWSSAGPRRTCWFWWRAGRCRALGPGWCPRWPTWRSPGATPTRSRPRMFAVLSTAWVVPGLIGPAIAALVAAAVGWRWVFLGLLPLVIAAGVLVVLALRHVPPPASPGTAAVPYLAALGVVAGAGTALASLSSGVVPVVAAGGVAGGALLAALHAPADTTPVPDRTAGADRHNPQPGAADVLFLRRRRLCPVCDRDRQARPDGAGCARADRVDPRPGRPGRGCRPAASPGGGRAVWSGRACAWSPSASARCAVVLLPAVPPALAVAAWALAGAGIGTAYAPLSVTTLDRAAPGEEGRATSALQLCDVLGQAIGTGVAGAIVAAAARHRAPPRGRAGVLVRYRGRAHRRRRGSRQLTARRRNRGRAGQPLLHLEK